MRSPEIEVRCYETYYFANVIRNILGEPFAYIRQLNDFYGDGRETSFSKPYPRFSAFHRFISFIIEDFVCDTAGIDLVKRQSEAERFSGTLGFLVPSPYVLPINQALSYYDIAHCSFETWLTERSTSFAEADDEDISDYYEELRLEGPMEELLDKVVDEVFFVLFGNRRVLLWFNDMMAKQISDLDMESVEAENICFFERSGMLRRVRPPQWVKRAVFFRDRGRCVVCRRDLSGIVSLYADEHYDHVIPLSAGGLNDVTNIQLLCSECNLKKSDDEGFTSDWYEAWYESKETA